MSMADSTSDTIRLHPLSAARARAGVSTYLLERRSGVSRKTIGRVERWEVWPRVETMRALLGALGLPVSMESCLEMFPDPAGTMLPHRENLETEA